MHCENDITNKELEIAAKDFFKKNAKLELRNIFFTSGITAISQ